ncbi:MAG: Lysine-tRNA ligase [Candidatus Roizmanbacteria bacterium GW2011_GWA2_36_23]|uniref:Lysine--tRNA ligase n=1 Tax=Candidatus Roizmanbacteria bacterium GW2011_GWA2_36_23 TaxID=1618480 RepID=A0A0G0E9M6_9BACT|nr:MAG: Lysine-tRNA ligase [Candidatus Roizmanbacteria bacterium GW2011_GWA2_36_23]
MIWVDRAVKKIKDEGARSEQTKRVEWVDDMKTPSGRIHVGSLRGVVVHDLIYKVLVENKIHAKFSYVFNDFDAMDGLPAYLDKQKWEKYMGVPLFKIPSPETGADNFAQFYAKEFIDVFSSMNCHPQIIWSHELYESGKMNDIIKLLLNETEKIRYIYKTVAKAEQPANWFPYNPVCEKCGKIGTTSVFKWDGEYVYYRCQQHMVKWAEGCSHEGKIEPVNGNGKLPWRLDWPAHWKVIGVTIESSGKDHMSSGGSYDMASHICRNILKIEPPDSLGGYEWFTIGGKKMSSSKGIGTSAKEASRILPPEVFRFLLVRTPITTHLDFDPYGETIPRLFDDYDRCLNSYFDKLENKIPQGKPGEVLLDFARIAELSVVRSLPQKRMLLPRFRSLVNLIKNNSNIEKYFTNQKKSELTDEEKKFLDERTKYAKIYLENYSQTDNRSNNQKPVKFHLTSNQRNFLQQLVEELKKTSDYASENLQQIIYRLIKNHNFKPKEVFSGFYRILINQDYGPKADDLLLKIGIKQAIDQIKNTLAKQNEAVNKNDHNNIFSDLQNNNIFTIDRQLAKKYPSITVGIAIIKKVSISPASIELKNRIDQFINEQTNLTNDIISSYPEALSYRKLYKETGIDWHSRRPSPEALLRRIATKKGLYSVNNCVDAYNLVVMRNKVSVGAFDLDKIIFPTILRFPKKDEEILLLGDKEPTKYKETEIAYFDQKGGYNIDFNYRDSQLTAISNETKNVLLNVDGVYEIGRNLVEKTLKESIEEIIKYCGGTLELTGIATADKL